jgi:hypothetical protein
VTKDRVKLDSRTAYAACLANDATPLMLRALNEREGLSVIVEILMNDPVFDHPKVTNALIAFYARYKGEHYHRAVPERIECSLPDPFFIHGSSKFLDYIVQACAPVRSKTTDTLAAYAITELVRRGVPLSHKAWEACVKSYPSDRFSFYAGGTLRLVDVPHT